MQYPIKLKDKIKFICKLLQRPYHLMTRITIGTYMFEIFDGTTEGRPINWVGHSPAAAVDEALEYLKHEIDMGTVKLPEIVSAKNVDLAKPVSSISTTTVVKTRKKRKK